MDERGRKIIAYYFPVALWLSVIFIASSQSHLPDIGDYRFPVDKIAHFLEYGVLGFLLVQAVFNGFGSLDLPHSYVVTGGIALFFAAADEFYQLSVPNRVASFADFIADCTGIAASLFVFSLYEKKRGRNT